MLTPVRFASFELNAKTRELRSNAMPVAIPPKVFDCLVYLVEHRDRAVGHDELMSGVWGQTDLGDRNIAQTILKLRRILGDSEPFQFIRTLAHFGYRWIILVEVMAQWPAAATVPAPASAAIAAPAPCIDAPTAALSEEKPPLEAESATQASDGSESITRARDSARGIRRPAMFAAATLAVLAAAFFFGRQWLQPATPISQQAPILVLPVAAGSVDGDHAWVRLGIMDLMAQRLRSHTEATVVPSETTVAIAGEALDGHANDRRLRELTGAGLIVVPAVELGADNQWTLKLRLLEPDSSPVELEEKGADVIQLASTLVDRIAVREGLPLRAQVSTKPDTIDTALTRAHAAWIGGHAQDALNLLAEMPPAEGETAPAILLKAQIEVEQGHFDDDTQKRLHQLIDQVADPENDSIVAQAELVLARVSAFHGDMPASEKILTQVLAGHALDHETLLLIDAYAQLGENLAFQAHWSEASEQLAKATLLAIGTGDLLSTATIDLCQGRVDQGRGQLEQAQQSLQKAAANFETLGELHDVKRARWNLLDVQFDQLALSAAQDTGRLIAANLPGERNAAFRVVDELALAVVSMRTGLYTDARLRLEEAQRDAASLADAPLYTHFVDVQMAELAVNAQDPEQAIQAATQAIDWFVSQGDAQGSLGRARLALSAAYRVKNQASLSEKLLASIRQQPANERAGHIDIELDIETARVAAATGHYDEAISMFDATYERARRESPPVMQVKAAGAYLEYLIRQQRLSEAEPVAAFLSRWTIESFDAALWVGRYAAASGRREAAVATFQQAHRLAGERWDNRVQSDWDELQKDSLKLTGVKAIVP